MSWSSYSSSIRFNVRNAAANSSFRDLALRLDHVAVHLDLGRELLSSKWRRVDGQEQQRDRESCAQCIRGQHCQGPVDETWDGR